MQLVRNLLSNRWAKLAAVVLVILAGYGLFSLAPETGFRVVKTNPPLKEATYFTPFIKFEFNEPLAASSVSVAKQDPVQSYTSSGNTLTVYLNALELDKRYTITIQSASSIHGSKLANKNFSFKAKDIQWEKLPKDQQDEVLKEQDKKPAASVDPIMQHLPHETPNYKLTGVVGQNADGSSKLTLEADITPVFADTLSDGSVPPETLEQYKKEVVDYIRSLNLDPAKYPLEYKVINPYAEQSAR